MALLTVKQLMDALAQYSDDVKVSILFECTEARPTGFQYEVPILDIAGTESHIRLCHEEDYPDHYSKIKKVKVVAKGEHFAAKTLEHQKITIETFGFGIDNYVIKGNQYVRK